MTNRQSQIAKCLLRIQFQLRIPSRDQVVNRRDQSTSYLFVLQTAGKLVKRGMDKLALRDERFPPIARSHRLCHPPGPNTAQKGDFQLRVSREMIVDFLNAIKDGGPFHGQARNDFPEVTTDTPGSLPTEDMAVVSDLHFKFRCR
jgi:hypothetical protein